MGNRWGVRIGCAAKPMPATGMAGENTLLFIRPVGWHAAGRCKKRTRAHTGRKNHADQARAWNVRDKPKQKIIECSKAQAKTRFFYFCACLPDMGAAV
jgi:hypothetical protein